MGDYMSEIRMLECVEKLKKREDISERDFCDIRDNLYGYALNCESEIRKGEVEEIYDPLIRNVADSKIFPRITLARVLFSQKPKDEFKIKVLDFCEARIKKYLSKVDEAERIKRTASFN